MAISETQRKILKHTSVLIYEKGYQGFSLDDVAHALNVSKVSVSYYYETKEDLVQAVIEHQLNEFLPKAHELEENDLLSTPEKLLKITEYLIDESSHSGFYICLSGMLMAGCPSLPDAIRIKVQWFFNELRICLDRILNTSSLENREDFINHLLLQYEGAALLGCLFHDKCYLEQVKTFIKDQVYEPLSPLVEPDAVI